MFNSKFMYGVIRTDGGRLEDPSQERAAQVRAEELAKNLEKRKAKQAKQAEYSTKIYKLGYKRGMIYALYNEGYGYSEIAAKTGLPESAVRDLAKYVDKD